MEFLRTFWTTPSILIKIIRDVEPALINGSGKPVGGTTPVTTATFKSIWIIIIDPIPTESKNPNLLSAIFATFKILTNNKTKIKIINKHPTKPNSSAIIENIKSDSANGRNKYFCLELKIPEPNIPPSDTAKSDWTNWNPSSLLDANGSINATSLLSLYGSIKISTATKQIAGIESIKKCLNFAPPTKSITTINAAIQIVIDIFGSKIINKQNNPPTIKIGSIPLNDFIFSSLLDKQLAAKTIKANFAISDGWKVITLKFIHLVAP